MRPAIVYKSRWYKTESDRGAILARFGPFPVRFVVVQIGTGFQVRRHKQYFSKLYNEKRGGRVFFTLAAAKQCAKRLERRYK